MRFRVISRRRRTMKKCPLQCAFLVVFSLFIFEGVKRCHGFSAISRSFSVLEIPDGSQLKYIRRTLRSENSPPPELPPSDSPLGIYDNGAVAADEDPCATIGVNVMKENGSAADATIATLFCEGVVVQESMGVGGGFLLVYYDESTKRTYVLDARETAPSNSFQDMFGSDPELSAYGGLSVAVPGEVRGYWELYRRFGGEVSWARLIQPTIGLCENGFQVSKHMAKALQKQKDRIMNEPTMSMYIDPSTGDVYQEGDVLFRPDLAKTLRVLQNEPDALYTGSLAEGFLDDLRRLGSIITKEDMENYRPVWRDPVEVSLANGDLQMHSVPPPGSGLILGFILNILDNYNFTSESQDEDNIVTTNQRIVESFKYGYAKRTQLGDEDFVDMKGLIMKLSSDEYARRIWSKIFDNQTSQDPAYYGAVTESPDTHGTTHVSVWGNDGVVIGVTSTVNLFFGANIASSSTGIVLNDEMDDFASPNITNNFDLPPSPANYITPGKRPLSSMSPAIFTDSNGKVRLVVGGAGGSYITTATALVSMNNLWFGEDIKVSIDNRRLHHQLFPMVLQYEEGYRMDIIEALESIGHVTSEFNIGKSVVNAISRGDDGKLYANSDFRKGASIDGF